jgi:hypothetical protein
MRKKCVMAQYIRKKCMITWLWKTEVISCKKEGGVFTPEVPRVPSDAAVLFKRLQFPLRSAPTMFVNKLYAKYLKVVVMNPETVFSWTIICSVFLVWKCWINVHILYAATGHSITTVREEALHKKWNLTLDVDKKTNIVQKVVQWSYVVQVRISIIMFLVINN